MADRLPQPANAHRIRCRRCIPPARHSNMKCGIWVAEIPYGMTVLRTRRIGRTTRRRPHGRAGGSEAQRAQSGYHHRPATCAMARPRAWRLRRRLDIKAELLELECADLARLICRTLTGPAVRLVKGRVVDLPPAWRWRAAPGGWSAGWHRNPATRQFSTSRRNPSTN